MRVFACNLPFPDAMIMRHIVTSFVAPLTAPDFSTFSHKQHDFLKTKLQNIKCAFSCSQKICLKHFKLSEEFSEILS
jgi:hypothetical protein